MKPPILIRLSCLTVLVAFLAGCGQPTSPPRATGQADGPPGAIADGSKLDEKARSHDGWWCDEHGVPEDECGQCNSKLAGEFQKKGDWCREHDRPDSQCFICHPELEAKFAARYEAKTGKKPPRPAG